MRINRHNIYLQLLLIPIIAFVLWGIYQLQEREAGKVSYQSFLGDGYKLYTWEGHHTVLLTQEKQLNHEVIEKILTITDSAYHLLHILHGREPIARVNSGKTVIAVVDRTCGIACGALGHQAIELSNDKFEQIYTRMKGHQQYDTVLFYELGRNFWFYQDQLYTDTSIPIIKGLRKGYAMFLRHLLVQELEVAPAPYNGENYANHLVRSRSLFAKYVADSSLSMNGLMNTYSYSEWKDRYEIDYPSKSFHAVFWASFLLYLHETPQHGLPFLKALFANLSNMNLPENDEKLLNQFIQSCAEASPTFNYKILVNKLKWKS